MIYFGFSKEYSLCELNWECLRLVSITLLEQHSPYIILCSLCGFQISCKSLLLVISRLIRFTSRKYIGFLVLNSLRGRFRESVTSCLTNPHRYLWLTLSIPSVAGQCFTGTPAFEKTPGFIFRETSQPLRQEVRAAITTDCIRLCRDTPMCQAFNLGKSVLISTVGTGNRCAKPST